MALNKEEMAKNKTMILQITHNFQYLVPDENSQNWPQMDMNSSSFQNKRFSTLHLFTNIKSEAKYPKINALGIFEMELIFSQETQGEMKKTTFYNMSSELVHVTETSTQVLISSCKGTF